MATWDEITVQFAAIFEVRGPTVMVRMCRSDGSAAKSFRCRTPFDAPNEYVIERVLDRAAHAWLTWLQADDRLLAGT